MCASTKQKIMYKLLTYLKKQCHITWSPSEISSVHGRDKCAHGPLYRASLRVACLRHSLYFDVYCTVL